MSSIRYDIGDRVKIIGTSMFLNENKGKCGTVVRHEPKHLDNYCYGIHIDGTEENETYFCAEEEITLLDETDKPNKEDNTYFPKYRVARCSLSIYEGTPYDETIFCRVYNKNELAKYINIGSIVLIEVSETNPHKYIVGSVKEIWDARDVETNGDLEAILCLDSQLNEYSKIKNKMKNAQKLIDMMDEIIDANKGTVTLYSVLAEQDKRIKKYLDEYKDLMGIK